MKNLKNKIAMGLIGLGSLGIFGNEGYGQEINKEHNFLINDLEIEPIKREGLYIEIQKVMRSYNNIYLSSYDAIMHAKNGRAYYNYFKSDNSIPAFENLKKEMGFCSKYLDSCASSLKYFTEHSNNTGIYEFSRVLYSDSGEEFFSEYEKTEIPFISDKAKEFLPEFIELKNMKDKLVKNLEITSLKNPDESNKFSLDLNIFLEKYDSAYGKFTDIHLTHYPLD